MAAPIFLAIEGCHGTGTSTHADALAEALRLRDVCALAWHHPRHPEGCDGLARVEWYAGARAAMAALMPSVRLVPGCAPDVVVMDRGPMSSVAYARATEQGAVPSARRDVKAWAERGLAWCWLDADDDTLDKRIAARGETPGAFRLERLAWRALCEHPARLGDVDRVDTGMARPLADVRADVLAWAERILKARGVL